MKEYFWLKLAGLACGPLYLLLVSLTFPQAVEKLSGFWYAAYCWLALICFGPSALLTLVTCLWMINEKEL